VVLGLRSGDRRWNARVLRRNVSGRAGEQAANRPRADGKGLQAQSHLLDEDARRHVREKVLRCSLESIASDAILVSRLANGEQRRQSG
jgi:hypothetical protein